MGTNYRFCSARAGNRCFHHCNGDYVGDSIPYQIEKRATVFAAAVHSVGVRLEVFPYLAEDIEEEARVQAGAAHTFGVRVDIYPHVYRKMNTEWRVQCAGYIQQTGKLEIFPQNRTEA